MNEQERKDPQPVDLPKESTKSFQAKGDRQKKSGVREPAGSLHEKCRKEKLFEFEFDQRRDLKIYIMEASTGHQPSSELSIRKKKQIRENKITQDNGSRQEVSH